MHMARKCFRKKDQSIETHQTTANNPEIPQTTFHIKPLTLSIHYSKLLCLFIISGRMGYQRCLIAQSNEHPYSLIWAFKRKT